MGALKNARYENFCLEIAGGTSQSDAYLKAGFTAKSAGAVRSGASRLLTKPEISARIAELKAGRAEQADVKALDLIKELAHVALANPLDYLDISSTGRVDIDLTEMTREQASAIASIKTIETTRRIGEGGEIETVTKVEVRFWNKTSAIVALADLIGAKSPKGKPPGAGDDAGDDDKQPLSDLELARRIAFVLKLGERELDKRNQRKALPAPAQGSSS